MDINITNMVKNYGKLNVINDLSIKLESNSIHCIFGPSGSGKTTLLNILAGLIPLDTGSIEGLSDRTISYVFQDIRLLPWATVEENVLFVLESIYDKNEAKKLAEYSLNLVELSKFKNYYPQQLSGGMQQRVELAKAFAYDGDFLLLDEPFKGLDIEIKKRLMNYIIKYYKSKNKQIIFTTHSIEEAVYLAKNIYIFKGPPLTLYDKISVDSSIIKNNKNKATLDYYKNKMENILNSISSL